MPDSSAAALQAEAEVHAAQRVAELRGLSFTAAAALPWATIDDIVLAGKEVQCSVFQQTGLPDAPEVVLVTVQLLRAGLGGTVNFRLERGLVFTADGSVRDATEAELDASR